MRRPTLPGPALPVVPCRAAPNQAMPKTLEAAMGIEELAEEVLATLEGKSKSAGLLQQPVDRRALN
jgi:hypothetical protein